MDNYTHLEKAILKTICWFDIFNHPLSLFEIWRYLYLRKNESVKYKISDVQEILENSGALKKIIISEKGYYFLKSNSKDLVKIRLGRYNIAEQKLKKAKRIIKILARFPFVKMIAICNTLAYRGANEGSDIDLFVIAGKNRIWWARFLILGFLSIFNLRPQKDDFKDKICLSFFIDMEHLNIKNVSQGDNDIYLIYWLNQLLPIYDNKIYVKFYQANSWIKEYAPSSEERVINQRLTFELSFLGRLIKKIWESIINLLAGNWTEKILKKWQIKKLPQVLKNKLNNGTDVMLGKGLVKLHLNDRRVKFYKLWQKKLKEGL